MLNCRTDGLTPVGSTKYNNYEEEYYYSSLSTATNVILDSIKLYDLQSRCCKDIHHRT